MKKMPRVSVGLFDEVNLRSHRSKSEKSEPTIGDPCGIFHSVFSLQKELNK
jgi:hypothetical protein